MKRAGYYNDGDDLPSPESIRTFTSVTQSNPSTVDIAGDESLGDTGQQFAARMAKFVQHGTKHKLNRSK